MVFVNSEPMRCGFPFQEYSPWSLLLTRNASISTNDIHSGTFVICALFWTKEANQQLVNTHAFVACGLILHSWKPGLAPSPSTVSIAVITVEPADKTSFVYSCIQTRLRGQYNGKWPISLVCVSKPLITVITAIELKAFVVVVFFCFVSFP